MIKHTLTFYNKSMVPQLLCYKVRTHKLFTHTYCKLNFLNYLYFPYSGLILVTSGKQSISQPLLIRYSWQSLLRIGLKVNEKRNVNIEEYRSDENTLPVKLSIYTMTEKGTSSHKCYRWLKENLNIQIFQILSFVVY